MKRRDFIRLTSASALGSSMLGAYSLYGTHHSTKFDRYGGWLGKKFEATGFFRVEKDKRWWIVTPKGNAFLSWGINHLYPDLWKQDYNREAWQKKLGIENLNGSEFNRALRKWFLDVREQLGFNTVGVHNSLNIINTPRPEMAYMQPIHFVNIPHWRGEIPDSNFVDVFSSDFERHCDRMAKEIAAPLKDDPYLLGYSMTDCPLLTEEDLRERTDTIGGARRPSRIGWPRRLRNLGSDAPGKRVYVETMKKIYRNRIKDFNTIYDTKFKSFDNLSSTENWRPNTQLSNANESRDNVIFLQRVVDKYYETTRNAIRRYDPNHMFVGDKLHANTDSLDTVLPITSKYTEIIMYQMYARYEVQKPGLDRWSAQVDKPFINGDAAFTMTTDTMPRPYGPVADNLKMRAEWTEEFFRSAFARPDFVGWHYCGLIDASQLVPRKSDRQHSGLLDGWGNPYPALEKVSKSCSSEIYSIAQQS
ncbi:MAG TPA: hypothetical protein DIV79_11930 [Opitutae bacterium]|nr:hypothetical protein [Opitutaceae bacterium]HCR30715.1 hypothetical protein [Opitutae bacterium]